VTYVVNLVQQQQIRVILVGTSLSNYIIAIVADRIPSLIVAVVFANGPVPKTGDTIDGMLLSSNLAQYLDMSDPSVRAFDASKISPLEDMYFSSCIAQGGIDYAQAVTYLETFKSPVLSTVVTLGTNYDNTKKLVILPQLSDPTGFSAGTVDSQTTVVQIAGVGGHSLPLCRPREVARSLQAFLAQQCPGSSTSSNPGLIGGRERGGGGGSSRSSRD